MDSRRAVASASSTITDLVALATWPLLWFCSISAMRSQLADEEPSTMLESGPGEQWPGRWSAQCPVEAHGVSLNHHTPVTWWAGNLFVCHSILLTELSDLSLRMPPFPRRPLRLAINVLLEEVTLLGSNEHCCIGSCLLEYVNKIPCNGSWPPKCARCFVV